VHIVGDVGRRAAGGQVGIVAQDDAGAARRHGVGGVALQRQTGDGDVVEADLGQRGGMAIAAPGIAVDLVHELADVLDAVADDQRRVAAGSGEQLVADDQQPVIVAGKVLFDEDVVAKLDGDAVGVAHLLLVRQVDRDALALVAVARLDDDREADFQRGGTGIILVLGRAALRHGDPGGVEKFLGQLFVLGDRFGNGAGEAGFGGLDAPLPAAPAELHEAALRQAAVGNAARDRRGNDGAGRRPEPDVLVQFAQLPERPFDIEGLVVQRRIAELFGEIEGQPADVFLGVFDDHLVDAGFDSRCRAAEGHRTTGLRLQSEGGEFQRMRHRDGVEMVGRNQVAKFGEAVAQAGFETGQVGDCAFGALAGDDGLDCRVPAPQIGAAQGANTGNVHESSSLLCQLVPECRRGRPSGALRQQGGRVGQFEAEGLDPGADHFLGQPQRPAGGDGGEDIGDRGGILPPADDRHVAEAAETDLVAAGGQHDAAVAYEHNAFAGGNVFRHDRASRVGGKEDDLAVGQFGHAGDDLVAGIEHRATIGQHDIDLRPVGVAVGREVLAATRVDIPAPEVFRRRVDIGDDAHLAAVVGQSFAEDGAPAVLDHRRLDGGVEQQTVAGCPVGAVGFLDMTPVDMQAIAAGQSDAPAGEVDQVGQQLGDGGLAMRSADADDRNAAAFAFGKQAVDNRLADRTRLADAGAQVHQQAGAGIHLDDRAALFVERPGNILADEIDAGDVETDDPRCQRRQRGGFRMNLVGDVERMVGVALDQDLAVPCRNRIGFELLAREFHARRRVDVDDRQRMQLGRGRGAGRC
jgi:hypothetical protein